MHTHDEVTKTNAVSDSIANRLLAPFSTHSLGHSDGGNSTRLGADNAAWLLSKEEQDVCDACVHLSSIVSDTIMYVGDYYG